MNVAETHFIAANFNRVGAENLVKELIRAFADGAELGPRGPHIRALGLSLQTLVQVLRSECDALRHVLVTSDQSDPTALPALAQLLATVEHLADQASADIKRI